MAVQDHRSLQHEALLPSGGGGQEGRLGLSVQIPPQPGLYLSFLSTPLDR